MMRSLCAVCLIFLLAACSSRTAEDAYKEGKYIESINLIASYVEEKGEVKLDNDDLERLRNIVSNVMAHYENQLLITENSDYSTRITSYESLLLMKNRLANRFYSQQVSFFDNKYEINQLRQLIAKEYYLYGNSVKGTDADSYYLKVELYRKGLQQYNYKDIEKLYNQTNTKYMQVAAKEYYEKGKMLAAGELYKDAAEYFSKAAEVYKPLGKYKDSQQLSVTYDKKYRLNDAQNFYQQAEYLKTTARTHVEFRKIAELYNQAATIYSPYGDYKNSEKLAREYQQKGIVKIYYQPMQYGSLIKAKINADYIQFVNDRAGADLIIDITESGRYNEYPSHPERRAMSENIVDKAVTIENSDGTKETKDIYKTYYYTIEATSFINVFELQTNITINGIYQYSHSDYIKKTSGITKYVYSGDVPNRYSNYTSGFYLSRGQLISKAKSEQERYINYQLTNLANILDRL